MNERIDVAHQARMLAVAQSQVAATLAAAAFARLKKGATIQDLLSLHHMFSVRLSPDAGRQSATQVADSIASGMAERIE